MVQFQYGEDSIDVLNSSFLGQLNFLANNADRLWQQQLPSANQQASKVAALGPMEKEAAKLNRCTSTFKPHLAYWKHHNTASYLTMPWPHVPIKPTAMQGDAW